MALLSGANVEPASVMVAFESPTAILSAAVAVTLYGTLNLKVPCPSTAIESHGLAGATVFVTGVAVMKSCEAIPPGGTKNSSLSGTVPPTITVTITNCGASTAFGSEIVTVPV